jgi:hypothetical protein
MQVCHMHVESTDREEAEQNRQLQEEFIDITCHEVSICPQIGMVKFMVGIPYSFAIHLMQYRTVRFSLVNR